jgi:hypothetical protein
MSEQFKSIETTELIKIANAIRVKTGNNEQIALKDMPDKIRSIEGGGIYLPELEFEGSSTDLLAGKQLIDSEGNIVTGTIPTTTQATPTISVNSAGKITATTSQSTGYVEAGTKTATHQLDVQAAQTITPSTLDKTIAAGKYLTGTQTIKGDANLKAENIAEGVSIFGIAGTHAGDSGGVVLPDLTNEGAASDLLSGKQLIDSDGNIVEGTIATKSASNLTANGATVTVPAGYYATQATKSVATATQATPSVSIDSTGKITATATQTEGYVTAGTKTGTKQLTTQAAKTVTPTKSSQTAVAKDRYTTGAITVAAIPAQYITTTDATATAADMRSGKTSYVNGVKVTGSIADFDGSYECSGESAGGGGSGGASVETCIIKFQLHDYVNDSPGTLYYMKPDMSLGTATYQASKEEYVPSTEVTAIKNSIAVITGTGTTGLEISLLSGNCGVILESPIEGMAFYITGDSDISLDNA